MGTLVVLLVPQVVVIHGEATGVLGVQLATPVGPVMLLPQVVAVQLFAEVAPDAVQDDTTTLVVLLLAQVVVIQDGLVPVTGVQEATGTPEVLFGPPVLQVREVQLLPDDALAGVQV